VFEITWNFILVGQQKFIEQGFRFINPSIQPPHPVTFVFEGNRTCCEKVKTSDTDTTLASLSAAAGFKTELVQDKATVSYKQYPIGIILMHFWKGS
jgi:hypothetical protein